jgi:hypothetical protein
MLAITPCTLEYERASFDIIFCANMTEGTFSKETYNASHRNLKMIKFK